MLTRPADAALVWQCCSQTKTRLSSGVLFGAVIRGGCSCLTLSPLDELPLAAATGTVRLVEGAKQGFIELEGSPDMVLEIVSNSSVRKDYKLLRNAYWKAGIREYWLVDARGEKLEFQILKHTSKGYSPIRPVGGWLKSAVFRKSFWLIATKNHLGHPDFELQVR